MKLFTSGKVSESKLSSVGKRDGFVDNIRGLVVLLFLMSSVFVNSKGGELALPDFFAHTSAWEIINVGKGIIGIKPFGFGLLDLGPIVFYFLIGVVAFLNINNKARQRGDAKGLYRSFFVRNLAIMGMGTIGCAIMILLSNDGTFAEPVYSLTAGNVVYFWSGITAVGFTGVLLTPLVPLVRKTWWAKLIASLAILTIYTLISNNEIFLKFMAKGIEGGMSACIGFAGALLFVGFLADLMRMKKSIIWYSLASVALVGAFIFVLSLPNTPENPVLFYPRYTIGYIVGALAVVNTVYYVLWIINKFLLKNRAIPLLAALGRNLLFFLMFTAFFSLLGPVFFGGPIESWNTLLLYYFSCVLFYFIIAIPLERRKIIIKL
ncbi:MAG: hypothetical protein LBQ27_03400 [Clostridiales bacterium]|nr:hypothetical protein [Clostridiales bacterium]